MKKTNTISRSVLYLINGSLLAVLMSASYPAANRTIENVRTVSRVSAPLEVKNTDGVGVSRRSHKYFLTERCSDQLTWEEVVLRNRIAAEKINSVIRREALKYRLIDEDAGARCSRQMDYKQECSIVYTNHDLISVYMSSYTHFKGAPSGWQEFSTLNFDASTGKRICFNDLFDSSYQKLLSLMMSNKLKKLYPGFEDEESEHWTEQFTAPEFRFASQGITVLLRTPEYGAAGVELLLDYNEIRPFVKNNGPLKTLYSRL